MIQPKGLRPDATDTMHPRTTLAIASLAAGALASLLSAASAFGQEPPPVVDDAVSDDAPSLISRTRESWPGVGESGVAGIGEEELETFEYDDAHQVVTAVPGTQVRGEDAFGLRVNIGIRGVTSDRSRKITMTEDGVLVGPAPYAAPAAYYVPLFTRMRGVNVVTGPALVRFGPNTVGGALDLTSRVVPEDGLELALDFAGGLDGYRKAHTVLGWGTDRVGFLFDGVYLGSEGFKELDGGGDTGFDRGEFLLSAGVASDRENRTWHRLDLRAGYAFEGSNETYLGLSDADFRDNAARRYVASENDRMDWSRWELRARYRAQFGEDTRWTTTLYRHAYARAWGKVNGFVGGGVTLFDLLQDPDTPRNRPFYDVLTGAEDSTDAEELAWGTNDRSYVSQGVQSVVRWRNQRQSGVGHDLEAGVRLHTDYVDRDHTEDRLAVIDGRTAFTDDARVTTTDNRGEAFALSAWALYELRAADWRIYPGLRAESVTTRFTDRLAGTENDDQQFALLPGLGVDYQAHRDLTLILGAHRGFSPATPSANDSADSEVALATQFGARWTPTLGQNAAPATVHAMGFVTDYRNLLGSCTLSASCSERDLDTDFNAGRARIAGLELLTEYSAWLGRGLQAPLRASYTLTSARFTDQFNSAFPLFGEVEDGDNLPYVPTHQASLSAGIGTWRWNAAAYVTYVGQMRERAGSGGGEDVLFTDAFATLDLAGSVYLVDTLKLYARIDNVTGSQALASRRPYGARPIKPFLALAGLRFER